MRVCRLIVLVPVVALLASGTVWACGTWSVEDQPGARLVAFHATATESTPLSTPADARRPITLMRLDGHHGWATRGWHLSAKGGRLYLDSQVVGSYSMRAVRVGKKTFRAAWGPFMGPAFRRYISRHPEHCPLDRDGQSVIFTEGKRVVLEGAVAGEEHCAISPVRRLALYLAWRELLGRTPR